VGVAVSTTLRFALCPSALQVRTEGGEQPPERGRFGPPRPYAREHHITDVMGGVALGLVASAAMRAVAHRFEAARGPVDPSTDEARHEPL